MTRLNQYLSDIVQKPMPAEVGVVADVLRQRQSGTLCVLTYGSVLRGADVAETLVDYYVIVASQKDLSSSILGQLAGHWLPPNVYYSEHALADGVVRCKYAVVTIREFTSWVSPDTRNPYFWARFCQPCAIAYVESEDARLRVMSALEQAVITATCFAKGFSTLTPLEGWSALFQSTYATEFRPEAQTRAKHLVAANAEHYNKLMALVDLAEPRSAHWGLRRVQGKVLSVLRLIKAAFTFSGGADYAAWKIERHSGERIRLTDWQKKHPVITGLWLLPKLLKRNAIR